MPSYLPTSPTPMLVASLGPNDRQPLRASIGVGGQSPRSDRRRPPRRWTGLCRAWYPVDPVRSNTLVAFAKSLAKGGTSIVAIVSLPSPLERIVGEPGVLAVLNARVTSSDELSFAAITEVGPLAILVDDVEQILDTPLAATLEGMLKTGRDHSRSIVIAGNTSELNAVSFRGLVGEARKSRAGLLLSPSAPQPTPKFLACVYLRPVCSAGRRGGRFRSRAGGHRMVQISRRHRAAEARVLLDHRHIPPYIGAVEGILPVGGLYSR